jgi:hypothetical protein
MHTKYNPTQRVAHETTANLVAEFKTGNYKTNAELAAKFSIGATTVSVLRLLYRERPDLLQLVLDDKISPGHADRIRLGKADEPKADQRFVSRLNVPPVEPMTEQEELPVATDLAKLRDDFEALVGLARELFERIITR